MRPCAKPSGQVVRVLGVENHPTQPGHVNITVGAETFVYAERPCFSGVPKFILELGKQATATIARDIFPNLKAGETLDGALFGSYAVK